MSSFIPYQINYSVVHNTVKTTIGLTKKKIVEFKFGFADHESIYKGQRTGSDCTGSEHTIILILSTKSLLLSTSSSSSSSSEEEEEERQLFVNGKEEEIHQRVSRHPDDDKIPCWQHIFPLIDTQQHNIYRIHMINTTQQQPNNNSNNNSNTMTTTTTTKSPGSYFYPYNIIINNISYFQFNTIDELGTSDMIVGQNT